ncbi:hypothetical protein N7536_003380 [Penicillium majusculum]|uniref:Enoyl reductase (ER) domain-containing protein n=1 Tax=Penicillium solitum TaxID=60172 RepID=A0A1V6Q8M4_9EURO|nr:uncharacterized protein PENSOL_c097G10553 [Penicillium solitum]KAJ5700367.1 hypothetical protein N7536_003380 [Penicillium majusculum]OQD85585.1 hypothetical protein PENSOL_c097G10553 [Penicillium solitum]
MAICNTSALVVQSAGAKPQLLEVVLDSLQANEVKIQIHATGICHTDLACMEGHIPVQFPNVFGHEGAGVVLERGSGVTDIQVGDKVLLSYNFCGECTQCSGNYPAYCENLMQLNFGGKRPDGSSTMHLPNEQGLFSNFFGQSSFAKIAVVSKSSVVRVPLTTDLQLFAPLGCGMQTGAGAVFNTLNVRHGSSVVVFGTGCVGLAGVMAAKIREARIIVAVDLQPERLDLARELGATHTFRGDDPDIRKHITDLCGSSRGADFALDCSGAITVIETMIATLGIRGRAASIGAPAPGRKVEVDVFSHLTMGRQYLGCHQGDSVATEMIPYLIEKQNEGKFPLEKLIKVYNSDDFLQAFNDMKEGNVLKPVLRWTSESQ